MRWLVVRHGTQLSVQVAGFGKSGAYLAAPRLFDFDHELADFVPYARVDWLGVTPSPRRRILDPAARILDPAARILGAE
jgi:hypothetical protein